MIEIASPRFFQPSAMASAIPARTADPARTTQIGSLRVCLMESHNFGGSARGLVLTPKLNGINIVKKLITSGRIVFEL